MTMQLTVTLPDEIGKLVSQLAATQGRPVDAVAREAIESHFASLGGMSNELAAMGDLRDEEVRAAADFMLPEKTTNRLKELRERLGTTARPTRSGSSSTRWWKSTTMHCSASRSDGRKLFVAGCGSRPRRDHASLRRSRIQSAGRRQESLRLLPLSATSSSRSIGDRTYHSAGPRRRRPSSRA